MSIGLKLRDMAMVILNSYRNFTTNADHVKHKPNTATKCNKIPSTKEPITTIISIMIEKQMKYEVNKVQPQRGGRTSRYGKIIQEETCIKHQRRRK